MICSDVHVVVVDDDFAVRRALARLLRSAGFRVSICESAEDFLTRSRELRATCLLLDVHLPRLSGIELRALLALAGHGVPVVFITADHELAHSAEMRRTERPCLTKPVDDEVLVRTITEAARGTTYFA